mgnify:FL=1
MKNLHFAIICSFNCVKHFNELEELTEEQRDFLFDLEVKAWSKVTEDDMQDFNFNGDYSPIYQAVKTKILEVLQDNKLTFTDNRCYGYLVDSVYEIVRTK